MAARRGSKLTVEEIKALPDGTTVWFTYHKGEDSGFRINCQAKVTRKGEDLWELSLLDGSSDTYEFVNFEDNPTSPAWDHACHTGNSYLYRVR